MIELTFLVDDIDYSDQLDEQLSLIFETMSQNGDLNPVLKMACKTPEATTRVVKGVLKTMTRGQKEKLAAKIINGNRERVMRKVNELAGRHGIIAKIVDCKAVTR